MTIKPNLEVPDTLQESITSKSSSIVDQVKSITIASDSEFSDAGEFLTTVVLVAISELNDAFDPIIADWHQGHKRTLATKRKLETPLRDAERSIKAAMSAWSREKARRAQEEARRIQEAAAEEVRRREEEDLLKRIEKALEGDDDEKLDRLVIELEGDSGEGRTSLHVYKDVTPLPVVVSKPRAEGVSIRTLKKYRVVDESKVKREFLMIDEVKIQRVVTAMGKQAEDVVGGIEFYEEESVAGSARR